MSELVELRLILAEPLPDGSGLWPRLWAASDDPRRQAELGARFAQRLATLHRALPALGQVAPGADDLPWLTDDDEEDDDDAVDGDGDDSDAALAQDPQRLARFAVLRGPWQGGVLCLRLADRQLHLHWQPPAGMPPALAAQAVQPALAAILADLAQGLGWQGGHWPQGRPLPLAAVLDRALHDWQRLCALQAHTRALGLRAVRRGQRSALALTLLLWGLALWALSAAVDEGRALSTANPAQPRSFVTQTLASAGRGLLVWPSLQPALRLEGVVLPTGPGQAAAPAQLRVSRAVYLRSAPGARYTVLPTADPAQPWVLRPHWAAWHADQPLLRGLGGLGPQAYLALALWLAWGGLVLVPWLRLLRLPRSQQLRAQHLWGSFVARLRLGAVVAAFAIAALAVNLHG